MTDREQFEEWHSRNYDTLPGTELHRVERQGMLKAWIAARAAPAQDVTATEWNEMRDAMENCRLYAARHRKEGWARTILDFCKEAGVTGSPLRAAPAQPTPSLAELFMRDFAESPQGRAMAARIDADALRDVPAQTAVERVLLTRNTLRDDCAWRESGLPEPPDRPQQYGREYAWAIIDRVTPQCSP